MTDSGGIQTYFTADNQTTSLCRLRYDPSELFSLVWLAWPPLLSLPQESLAIERMFILCERFINALLSSKKASMGFIPRLINRLTYSASFLAFCKSAFVLINFGLSNS